MKDEKGAALIIVLGVVAMIAAWAATAAYEDMVSLRRAENLQQASRAYMASESLLAVAQHFLREDAKDSVTDDLEETWAQAFPPLPLDEGLVAGEIVDENRYFNLNDLVNAQGQVDPLVLEIAKRLFFLLEVPTAQVDKLVDWMDADGRTNGPSGAEDGNYYDKPYRIKNARLDRWQELGLIDGFDAAMQKVLRSVFTVRPVPATGKTLININTADQKLLMALFPKMQEADAMVFIGGRPYDGVAAAVSGQLWATGVDVSRLSVASDAFSLRVHASFGRVNWREAYMLNRTSGKVLVAYREPLGWEP